MAFVHKSERKLTLYQNHNNIGPGSYIGLNSYKKKQGKVPFCISSEKSVSRVEVLTPGPGSYLLQTSKPRPTNNIIQSSSFASQIERFQLKQCKSPGPGAYETQPWPTLKQSNKTETTINWIRQPSAPSIPREGYCYSDDESGELVMKKVSESKESLVGPGYYDPKSPNKPRLYIWGRPQTSRTISRGKSCSPGPGTYDSKSPKPRYKDKESASFLSRSKRDGYLPEFISEKDVPGPGRYNFGTAWNQSHVNRVQNFGSRCERFRALTPDVQPGPGSYLSLENGKFGLEGKVPFDSTGPRFVECVDAGPGPGSYDTKVGVRPTQSRGRFGAGQDRFNYYTELKDSPGPGSYDSHKTITSQRPKGSSVFISKSKRLPTAVQTFTPAPGSYEVVKKMGEVKSIGSVVHPILVREGSNKAKAFNIQSERFDEKNRSFTPGPGSYKLSTIKKSKGFIVAKNPRFKETLSESPGPGSYSDMKGWNKKTFNALFDLK
jgi:hypothetical protein